MSTFTVGIANYNNARYLPCAIESASRADEIIVVDDASTDMSRDIIESYAVRCIRHEENSGTVVAAWNELIDAASCDWLVLLSADDMLHATTLAQVEAFGREADWVWGNLDIIDADGHQYDYYDYRSFPRDVEGCLAYMRETQTLYPTMIAAFRVSWLRENHLRAEHFASTIAFPDTLTGWKWLHANPRLKYTQLPFAFYRRHTASDTDRYGTFDAEGKRVVEVSPYYEEFRALVEGETWTDSSS